MKSYQKIHGDHKPEVEGIYDGTLYVEEKIDGSQFRIEVNGDGTIKCGSHHQELDNVDSMFKKATDIAQQCFANLKISPSHPPVTIFAEYLAKPAHNVIPYQRVPNNHIAIFDILWGEKGYLDRDSKELIAKDCGVDVVPLLWKGDAKDFTDEVKQQLLKTPSYLGHQPGHDRIEGIVIKNYGKMYTFPEGHSLHGHFMCTKIVNESFKESKHIGKPAGQDITEIINSVKSEARWNKAIQHLKEKGEIEGNEKDIGKIIREAMSDLELEEGNTIKEQLYKIFRKQILSGATEGLAQWYFKRLKNEI